MLRYEEFKNLVSKTFVEYLPEEYKGIKIQIQEVNKVNQMHDFLQVMSSNGLAPAISLNDLYDRYRMTGDLRATIQAGADIVVRELKFFGPMEEMMDINTMKDNIIFQLIHTERNAMLLKNVPHRDFLDLSIVYRWLASINDHGSSSVLISHELAAAAGLDEEQLFTAAAANTKRLLPTEIAPLDKIVKGINRDQEPDSEEMEAFFENLEPQERMYFIGNKRHLYGAAAILYQDDVQKLADSLGSNLYILPASIHETIALSVTAGTPKDLSEMVSAVNKECVEAKDWLSDKVYFYNRTTQEMSLVEE